MDQPLEALSPRDEAYMIAKLRPFSLSYMSGLVPDIFDSTQGLTSMFWPNFEKSVRSWAILSLDIGSTVTLKKPQQVYTLLCPTSRDKGPVGTSIWRSPPIAPDISSFITPTLFYFLVSFFFLLAPLRALWRCLFILLLSMTMTLKLFIRMAGSWSPQMVLGLGRSILLQFLEPLPVSGLQVRHPNNSVPLIISNLIIILSFRLTSCSYMHNTNREWKFKEHSII